MSDHQKPIVAVFCGSKGGENPQFLADAAELGKILANNGFEIVYGGSSLGLMGSVAKNAINAGGRVTGVLPEVLVSREPEFKELTHFIVVQDMHVRKKTMYEMCTAAIILPGGFGTLDELFEAMTLIQTRKIKEFPVIIFCKDYHHDMLEHIERMKIQRTISEEDMNLFLVTDSVEQAVEHLSHTIRKFGLKPLKPRKWLLERD
jgi:uncharacterized protein (TIGR00730 family)